MEVTSGQHDITTKILFFKAYQSTLMMMDFEFLFASTDVHMLNAKGVTNISSMLHLKGPFHYLMEVFPGDTNLFEL